jgi:hypothetical protein
MKKPVEAGLVRATPGRSIACKVIYFFAKPMPRAEFLAWLQAQPGQPVCPAASRVGVSQNCADPPEAAPALCAARTDVINQKIFLLPKYQLLLIQH